MNEDKKQAAIDITLSLASFFFISAAFGACFGVMLKVLDWVLSL